MMSKVSDVSVCLAALYHHIDLSSGSSSTSRLRHRSNDDVSRKRRVQFTIIHDIIPAAFLYLLPPHSVVALLRPCVKLVRQWPKLLSKSTLAKMPKWLTGEAGPYGYGAGKFCEVICAYSLLSIRYSSTTTPEAFELGPMPSRNAILLVLLLSVGVNLVLSLWSKLTQSKGNHSGVNAMVEKSIGRRIGLVEHLHLGSLAFGNAICEEVVSRGFFYYEFVQSAKMTRDVANVAQAAAFGIWHYNGIPSGLTGVGLTFVYGLIMGLLREYGNGLLLPILAHSIADYFIFFVLVR